MILDDLGWFVAVDGPVRFIFDLLIVRAQMLSVEVRSSTDTGDTHTLTDSCNLCMNIEIKTHIYIYIYDIKLNDI